ncbi:TPA: di-trans,poly-cis-decaprenylcistransferase, partial [Patescibacteria group bacterium]|nr:di-trans,poly-cis-decaprenylcistransferase [Patescibacteria group bacterium]
MSELSAFRFPVTPTHIAIIMDGNRRWAREKRKHVLAGHRYVADVLLEELVEHAADRGIKYVTFWAWSTENWKRTKEEVSGVIRIFQHILKKNIDRLHRKGVRVKTIGNIEAFPKEIAKGIRDGVEKTKDNKRITVILALNYGGRDEIIRAVNKIIGSTVIPAQAGIYT